MAKVWVYEIYDFKKTSPETELKLSFLGDAEPQQLPIPIYIPIIK